MFVTQNVKIKLDYYYNEEDEKYNLVVSLDGDLVDDSRRIASKTPISSVDFKANLNDMIFQVDESEKAERERVQKMKDEYKRRLKK